MHGKMTVVLFDLDKTITTRDTLFEFIRFTHGKATLYRMLFSVLPLLVLYKLGFRVRSDAKERFFSLLYAGMSAEAFDRKCREFYCQRGRHLIRPEIPALLKKHQEAGCRLGIVSASIVNWVRPFAAGLGIQTVEGTHIEILPDGRLSGKFASANCNGAAKVERIRQLCPARERYHIIAYGDSPGDYPMLAYADEAYLWKEGRFRPYPA